MADTPRDDRLGRNIVVLSENHGGEVDWMPAAYDVMEETPYDFASPDGLHVRAQPRRHRQAVLPGEPLGGRHRKRAGGRRRGRQQQEASWTERLDECRRDRGRQPGILAVDFVDVGDVLAVVDDLNRGLVPD